MIKALLSRKGFAVAAIALLALVLPAIGGASVPAPPSGYTLTWSDDFTGAAGTGLNTGNWLYDTGHCYPGCPAGNWGTGEVENNTTSTANVFQDGAGHLVIKPIRDGSGNWTSGRVETQRTDFSAGSNGILRIQASLQQPNVSGAAAQGYWPAFWTLGAPFRGVYTNWPSAGEIDILEDIDGQSNVYGTFHCGVNPGGPCNETSGIGSGARACSGCQTGYHTYAMELDKSVSPNQIRFYLDGANYFTINSNQVDATTWANATNHGFFAILNVAIGGGWPGNPTGSTASGVPMNVDYVAVYNKAAGGGGGGGRTGAITGNGGKCVDVNAASNADGTKIQLWTCNNTSAQQWTWNTGDGAIHALGKCMDIAGGGTADGTKIQLYTCNGTGAQKWVVNANGTVTNPQSGKCLDDPNFVTTDGTQLQIATCNGSAAQVWHMP
jgi:beta-glucanase (GH16 family)